MNPEVVKRLIVDSLETKDFRDKFFSMGCMEEDYIKKIVEVTPKPISTPYGFSWGGDSLTMVMWHGIENLHRCIKNVIEENISGDFIETGVWRGGMCILAHSTYNHYNRDIKIFLADSFNGLPPPNILEYPEDAGDIHYKLKNFVVSKKEVINNLKKFNIPLKDVSFLDGWFKDTLPYAPIDKLSILRLDGDMYESTINALDSLYHKLSIGGYCIIDDFLHFGCNCAVRNFRKKHNIKEKIIKEKSIYFCELYYWRKEFEI